MARVVIHDKITLDFFLMRQNSIYAITDIAYCMQINILDQVERSMQTFKKKKNLDFYGLCNL